jgi:predicted  nucleic acid-binding Zn-ribbon protein
MGETVTDQTTEGADPDDLERLLALQAIDDEVRRLEHQLEGLVEHQQLDELLGQDRLLAEGDADLREQLERAQRDQRQVEGEIDALGRRLEEEQSRLYQGSLSNAREIQAAEAEISSTRRRRSEHEDQLLEIMEVVEGIEGRLAELVAVRQGLAARIGDASGARDTAARELLVRITEVRVRRDPLTGALPPGLLERYEKAAERGSGTGVGVLRDQACTACRISFPMTEIDSYLSGPPLTTCSQCRRLLIVPA